MSENPPPYPPQGPGSGQPQGPPPGGYPQYPQGGSPQYPQAGSPQYPQAGSPQYPQGGQPQGGYPQGGQPGGYPPGGYQAPPPGQPAYGTPYGPPGAQFGQPPGASPGKRWYKRWWVWLLAVIAIFVVLALIFASNHVSSYQLESKVKDAFAAQGLTVTDVHCPDNVNTDKGSTTSCTGVFQGSTKTFSIRFDKDRHFLVTGVR